MRGFFRAFSRDFAMDDLAQFAPALTQLWPHGDSRIAGLRAAMTEQLSGLYTRCGLTPMALADMMGEFTEECGGGIEVEETSTVAHPNSMRSGPRTSRWNRRYRCSTSRG
jgi:putative chitinase